MKKKKYISPQFTIVKLNPAQAILSVCSTTFSSNKGTGSGTKCKSGNCKKKSSQGDSLGHS
jgi:hypothetical protein